VIYSSTGICLGQTLLTYSASYPQWDVKWVSICWTVRMLHCRSISLSKLAMNMCYGVRRSGSV